MKRFLPIILITLSFVFTVGCITDPDDDEGGNSGPITVGTQDSLTIQGVWLVDGLLLKRTTIAVIESSGDTALTTLVDTTITGNGTDTITITDSSFVYTSLSGTSTYSSALNGSDLDVDGSFLITVGATSYAATSEYTAVISDGKLYLSLRREYSYMEPYSIYNITRILQKYDFILSPAG